MSEDLLTSAGNWRSFPSPPPGDAPGSMFSSTSGWKNACRQHFLAVGRGITVLVESYCNIAGLRVTSHWRLGSPGSMWNCAVTTQLPIYQKDTRNPPSSQWMRHRLIYNSVMTVTTCPYNALQVHSTRVCRLGDYGWATLPPLWNSKGNPVSGGVKYTGLGKISDQ